MTRGQPESDGPRAAPPTAPADEAVAHKLARLEDYLRRLGSVLVCYSGGVDSALLLAAAHRAVGARAVGMTALSPSLAPSERREAAEIAAAIGAEHRVVESREFDDESYVANRPDRCFHCKSELYRIARDKQRQWGLAAVVNGANVDDLGDYRPGLQAAVEAGVLSPLVELGFTKADVRSASRLLGLPTWDKPAAACLASRVPYGTAVTAELLTRIAAFEGAIKKLGFRQVRVRYHDALARLELGADELDRAARAEVRARLVEEGKRAGFQYVTLDLGGYRQGSHNEVLAATATGPERADSRSAS